MRLIDADALNDEMYHKSFEVDDGRNVWNSGLWIRYKIFEEAIRDAPTVEAVHVIRCKDCKHYADDACDRYADETLGYVHSTQADGFCWVAERKDNG